MTDRLDELISTLSKYPFFSNIAKSYERVKEEGPERLIDFLRLLLETLESEYRALSTKVELLRAKLSELEEAKDANEERAIVEAPSHTTSTPLEVPSEDELLKLLEPDVDEMDEDALRDFLRKHRDALRSFIHYMRRLEAEHNELQERLNFYQAAYERYQQLARAYQQLKEDFESYKRRIERNLDKLERETRERVLSKFISVLDNFDYALKAAKSYEASHEASALKEILKGIEMIRASIEELLREEGLEAIDASSGKFDPRYHEVFEVVEREDLPDETIVEQVRRGYKLMDKVLRPALVKVSRNPKSQQQDSQGRGE